MRDTITVEYKGHVMLVGLNRPEKRNRFNLALIRELSEAYTELSRNDDLRCGVVFAYGEDFTFGLDAAEVLPRIAQEGPGSVIAEGQCNPWRNYGRECDKPIVLAVQGRCLTSGFELALASELCVAADNASFGQVEATRGVMPFGGATYRLPALLGWHNAMKFMLTDKMLGAHEAKAMGLVQDVVALGQEREVAIDLAENIARQAPIAVREIIANARLSIQQGHMAAQNELPGLVRRMLSTDDVREGFMSLVEKRPAVFRGQ